MISPWNFPVAIPCGMIAAGLATGNAVVLKPAEQAPGCACDARARAARGGRARRTRSRCCRARATSAPRSCATRACTRSPSPAPPQVGLEIVRTRGRDARRPEAPQARDRRDGRQELRDRRRRRRPRRGRARARARRRSSTRARSAPRPRACSATRRSTTGCVERLAGAVEVLEVGQAGAARHRRAARDRARGAGARRPLRAPRRSGPAGSRRSRATVPRGRLVRDAGGRRRAAAATRRCCRRRSSARCSRSSACATSPTACDRVDASPFALTGGLFARNPDTVDYVVDRSPVGNLYVNRAITGAMVARQPFGGNRLSRHRHEGRRARATCSSSSSRAW